MDDKLKKLIGNIIFGIVELPIMNIPRKVDEGIVRVLIRSKSSQRSYTCFYDAFGRIFQLIEVISIKGAYYKYVITYDKDDNVVSLTKSTMANLCSVYERTAKGMMIAGGDVIQCKRSTWTYNEDFDHYVEKSDDDSYERIWKATDDGKVESSTTGDLFVQFKYDEYGNFTFVGTDLFYTTYTNEYKDGRLINVKSHPSASPVLDRDGLCEYTYDYITRPGFNSTRKPIMVDAVPSVVVKELSI